MTAPTYEPQSINPDVTVTWTKTFADYSYNDGYTSAFYVINGTGRSVTITGVYASGAWTFTLKAANNDFAKGTYRLTGYVQKGADGDADMERYGIYNAPLMVTLGSATEVTTDQRDQYQREKELIDAAIENYATDPVEEATVGGKMYRRPSIMTLQRLRMQLIRNIANENKKIAAANGRSVGGRFLATMSSPR